VQLVAPPSNSVEVQVQANLQDNGENVLTIVGKLGTDDVSTATIEAHVLDSAGNDSGQICARLRVMALPPRTVSLGIYRVQDPTSVDTLSVGGPTDAQIMAALNDIYQQAGIRFVLEGSSSPSADSPATLNIRYDTYALGLTLAGDGRVQESEDVTIMRETANRPGRLKVYLANNSGLHRGSALGRDDDVPLADRVYARGDTPDDFGPLVQSFVFTNTTADNKTVGLIVAHEVGHMLGLEHDLGAFPAGTWPDGPLMKPGNGTSRMGRWLSHLDWKAANIKATKVTP
jgi:hypothetical protein